MTKDDIKCFENGVIVHFSSKGKTPHEKFNQLEEIRQYADDYRTQKELDFVWYYLITDLDPIFEHKMEMWGHRQLFHDSEKIYYKYFERGGLHLFVMASPTPVADLRGNNEFYLKVASMLNEKVEEPLPVSPIKDGKISKHMGNLV
jgi:hypothetical protein